MIVALVLAITSAAFAIDVAGRRICTAINPELKNDVEFQAAGDIWATVSLVLACAAIWAVATS